MTLNSVQVEINLLLEQLDDTARGYEARWGVGTLERHAPPAMLEKWQRQIEKLDAAIIASDLPAMRELVPGTMRGWQAMERHATDAGHAPLAPDAWECRHPESGQVYRIVKTMRDTLAPAQPGTVTWSLPEIVRVLEGAALVNEVKKVIPTAKLSGIRDMDWKAGEIPW